MPAKEPNSVELKKLRVLHVIPSIAACRGGPSKAVIEMVRALRKIDIDAEIITTNDNGPKLLQVSLQQKQNYLDVPITFFRRFSPPINAVREFAYSGDLKRWLHANISNFDLIHVHAVFSYSSTITMAIARKMGVPYLIRPIGQLQHWSLKQANTKKKIYLKLIESKNIENASAAHFTSHAEMQEANQYFNIANGHVIPLGIDTPSDGTSLTKAKLLSRFNLNDSEFNILYLSRLHEKKGLELLLKAFSESKHNSALWIAGDGAKPYVNQLKQYAQKLNISKNCFFLGHVDGENKHALLNHADLFVLSSHSENFGVAVLEAMSAGLTPLVSREVALSNQIKDNKLGLVCDVNVNDIKAKLNYARDNKNHIKNMGLRAAEHSKNHYSWSIIANKLRTLYYSLI